MILEEGGVEEIMGSRGNSSYTGGHDQHGMAREYEQKHLEKQQEEIEDKDYKNEKIEFYRLSRTYEREDVFFELNKKNIDKLTFDLGGEEIRVEGRFTYEESEEYLKLKKQAMESSILPYVYEVSGQYNMAGQNRKVEGEIKNVNFYFDIESDFEFSQGIFSKNSTKRRFYIGTFNEYEVDEGQKYEIVIKQDDTKTLVGKISSIFNEIAGILKQMGVVLRVAATGNLIGIIIEGVNSLFMIIDSLEKVFNVLSDSEYLNQEVNLLKSVLNAVGACVGREIDKLKRKVGDYTGDDVEVFFEKATYEIFMNITVIYSGVSEIKDAKENLTKLANENKAYEKWEKEGKTFDFSNSLIIRAKKGEKLSYLEGKSEKIFYLNQLQGIYNAYGTIGSKTHEVLRKLSNLIGNGIDEIGGNEESGQSGPVIQNQYNVEIKKDGKVIFTSSTRQVKAVNLYFDMDDSNAKGSREREVIVQIFGELPFIPIINNLGANYREKESIVEELLFSKGIKSIFEVNLDIFAVDGEKDGTSLTHESTINLKKAILIDYSESYACAEKNSIKGKNESFTMKFKPWNNSYENIEVTQVK